MLSAITEFPVSNNGQPYGLTLAPDGSLWFGVYVANAAPEVGRITPSGVVTEFPLPAVGSPESLTVAPDGNLWFTTPGEIDRITPSGAVTEFPLPRGSGLPDGLTVGSDGNLWFSLSEEVPAGAYYIATDIGRITTAGVVTEFPLPAPGFSIGRMTLGPDGNIWFSEATPSGVPPFVVYGTDEIGSVTPSGVVTSIPLSIGYSPPGELTVGPDGNFWFTKYSVHDGSLYEVDRITTAGDVTQFPIPGGLNPGDLTVGPDGNLWFSETSNAMIIPQFANSGAIGRITTKGAITQFPLVANADDRVAAGDLTVAPDGALWFIGSPFTPGQDGVIGRITPAGVLTEVPISPGIDYSDALLSVGSDGNLWFAEPDAGKVARIDIGDVPTIAAVARSGGRITAITFDFPDDLNPATARTRGFYVIDAPVKRHHQLAYSKTVRIRRISYRAAMSRVALKLAGPQKGSLQVAVMGGILSDGGTSSDTVLEALVE